jgi:hypothetical protein
MVGSPLPTTFGPPLSCFFLLKQHLQIKYPASATSAKKTIEPTTTPALYADEFEEDEEFA